MVFNEAITTTEPDPRGTQDDELPHEESDIRPDELVEPEPELPEPEKELEDNEVKVVEEDKVPLPEVYDKGSTPPEEVPDEVLEPHSDPPPITLPAELNEKKPPRPLIPKLSRAESEATPDFKARFREQLKNQLHQANQIRSETVEENLDKIMDYAREHNKITNDEVEQITGVGDVQAWRYLKMLSKRGKLIKFGIKKNTFYKPVKK